MRTNLAVSDTGDDVVSDVGDSDGVAESLGADFFVRCRIICRRLLIGIN